MASAVKRRLKKFFNYTDGCHIVNETCREHKYIGIIMTAGKLGKLNIPAYCRTYSLMFIECYPYAVA